jgi:hypothetical protein
MHVGPCIQPPHPHGPPVEKLTSEQLEDRIRKMTERLEKG